MKSEIPPDGSGPGLHRLQALVAELTVAANGLVDAPMSSLPVAEQADVLVAVDGAARLVDATRVALIRSAVEDLSSRSRGTFRPW
jgi:hypothetical protein